MKNNIRVWWCQMKGKAILEAEQVTLHFDEGVQRHILSFGITCTNKLFIITAGTCIIKSKMAVKSLTVSMLPKSFIAKR